MPTSPPALANIRSRHQSWRMSEIFERFMADSLDATAEINRILPRQIETHISHPRFQKLNIKRLV
jgi:hypothetical protein